MAITAFGDIGFEYFTFVINGPPEIVKLTIDFHEHFVEMPRPVRVIMVLHAPLADLCCEQRTKPVPPEAHRLVRDIDPALVEQVLDVSQRKWETDIHHHS